MKKLTLRILLAGAGVLVIVAALGAQYATKVYIEQGGAKQVIASGGEIEVQSGATLDIQSGATFTIASSSFNPTSYVPVTKAGQQTMSATGATNDITFSATDDIIFAAGGDDFVVNLTPDTGDAFVVEAGAPGANGFDIFAADNDLLLTTYDATRSSFLEVNSGGIDAAPATGTYFAADVGGGTNELHVTEASVALSPTTSVAVDVAGGVDELGVSDKVVSVAATAMLRLVQQATPPATCEAGTEGGLYLDADTHLLCVCNASAWVQIADGSTGCS